MSWSRLLTSLASMGFALFCLDGQHARAIASPKAATSTKPKSPAAAASQTPAPAADNYEDRSMTFVARSSQLEWQKTPTAKALEFEAAEAYCNTLNLTGGGWRLPTRVELRALLNDQVSGTGPSFAVPGLDSDSYWSSTLRTQKKKRAPEAWCIDFSESNDFSAEFYFTHKVRCVRTPR